MKMRLTGAAVALFLLATTAFARVLSYAPYTDRLARPAYQDRASRYFVLIEDDPRNSASQELILYGFAREPRKVFPKEGTVRITGAALVDRPDFGDPPAQFEPLLLVFVGSPQPQTLFSRDGGATWKELVELRGRTPITNAQAVDYGGPWTRGLNASIRVAPASFVRTSYPFIVSYFGAGTWKFDEQGAATHVGDFVVVGQNPSGSKVLGLTSEVEGQRGYAVIHKVDLATGAMTRLGRVTSSARNIGGWIGTDENAYIQLTLPDGRFLYQHRGQGLELIAGPRDARQPDLESPLPVPGQLPRDERSFFAVPTMPDFSGAWMIQRDPGRPTTLLRYSQALGVVDQWTDVSGPEVEALIPGRSGQTVLVQVHRDRNDVTQRAFIDPALAVWRVGEGAPREYDELFLDEQPDKGFVVVDPDRLAAGDSFVFNSGTSQPIAMPGPISSPPVGGGSDVVQEWGVVRGSLAPPRLVLPGVARTPGAFGSNWLTDVTIYNPLALAQNVRVGYSPLGDAVGRSVTVTLQPREIRFIPDVLQTLFALETGGGSLYLTPDSGVNAIARTYSRGANGTYGFGMQAIDTLNAATARFPVTFAGAFPGADFRTNILLTATSRSDATTSLRAYGVSGAIGNDTSVAMPAGRTVQINGVSAQLGLSSRDAGGLVVQPTRSDVIATVVAIDNRTNDPTYFPPDLAAGGINTIRAIPVIGHVEGANGSRFRSDIYLFNPTEVVRTVTLEAKAWDSQASRRSAFTLLPREARVIPDALPTLFEMTGLARLRYWTDGFAPGGGVRVTSRTYTIDASGATYGSLIPPLNNFQIAATGDALEILGTLAGNGFRVNLGLVELSPVNVSGPPVQVRVRLLDRMSRELDSFLTDVARAEGKQINDIFSARAITPGEGAMIVVEVVQGGLIGAYATLTDNQTNDTTYLGAQLAATK